MPVIRTPAEELAVMIGEAITDDVQAWQPEPASGDRRHAYLRITTADGAEYGVSIWQTKEKA